MTMIENFSCSEKFYQSNLKGNMNHGIILWSNFKDFKFLDVLSSLKAGLSNLDLQKPYLILSFWKILWRVKKWFLWVPHSPHWWNAIYGRPQNHVKNFCYAHTYLCSIERILEHLPSDETFQMRYQGPG